MKGKIDVTVRSAAKVLVSFVALFERVSDLEIEYRLQDENLAIFNQGIYISSSDTTSITITERGDAIQSFEVSFGKSLGSLLRENFFIVLNKETSIRTLYPSDMISEIVYQIILD